MALRSLSAATSSQNFKDLTDNVFAEPVGRFAAIEEDEELLRLLVSDYPT